MAAWLHFNSSSSSSSASLSSSINDFSAQHSLSTISLSITLVQLHPTICKLGVLHGANKSIMRKVNSNLFRRAHLSVALPLHKMMIPINSKAAIKYSWTKASRLVNASTCRFIIQITTCCHPDKTALHGNGCGLRSRSCARECFIYVSWIHYPKIDN